MEEEQLKRLRTVRSFVRRQGRFTEGQRQAFEQGWQRYGLPFAETRVDWQQLFGRDGFRGLEIGFGNGESLFHAIRKRPEQDWLGVEVHLPGVGKLFMRALEAGLDNLRVSTEDVLQVLHHQIPDASFDEVRLFFPDPWHKKRHHKRRIVQPAFAQEIRRVLKPGGIFHLATDWADYAEHMQQVLDGAEGFAVKDKVLAADSNPPWRVSTKFEQRGRRLGHKTWDLRYRRTG